MQLGRLGALAGFSVSAIGAGVTYVDPSNKTFGYVLVALGAATLLVSVPRWAYANRVQIRARLGKVEQSHLLLAALIAALVLAATLAGAWLKSGQQKTVGGAADAPAAQGAKPDAPQIPGIPATKAGINAVLDQILPALADLVGGDGVAARESLRKMSGEAAALLVEPPDKGGRFAATDRVRDTINQLDKFQKSLQAIKDRYRLHATLILWIIGDEKPLLEAREHALRFEESIGEIPLPPITDNRQLPSQLLSFWKLGKEHGTIDYKAVAGWLTEIEGRIQTVHADFGKRAVTP